MRGGAEDAHPAGGVFDDGQDVQPGSGQRDGFEEVGREDGLGLGVQKRRPTVGVVRSRMTTSVIWSWWTAGS
jgi:hypothetical protein